MNFKGKKAKYAELYNLSEENACTFNYSLISNGASAKTFFR